MRRARGRRVCDGCRHRRRATSSSTWKAPGSRADGAPRQMQLANALCRFREMATERLLAAGAATLL
jgi:hypothetical protein